MQRAGKMHAAASDGGTHRVDLRDVIKMVRACQRALVEHSDEDAAAIYFEILGDYLEDDVVKKGKSLAYTDRMLGL